jgi:hypothetical protein
LSVTVTATVSGWRLPATWVALGAGVSSGGADCVAGDGDAGTTEGDGIEAAGLGEPSEDDEVPPAGRRELTTTMYTPASATVITKAATN